MVAAYIDLQKLTNALLLALAVIGGIVVGMLSGQVLNLSFGGEPAVLSNPKLRQTEVKKFSEEDFQTILSRNLFDSQAAGKVIAQVNFSDKPLMERGTVTARPMGELTLIGTVVAGEDSLALIQVGHKVDIFRLHETIVPGVELLEVARQLVVVRERGVRRELLLQPNKSTQPRQVGRKTDNESGVTELGSDHWKVSKAKAEHARANLNELLKSARMVPQLENGETVGFKLVNLKKGSLLEQIGLKVGDLVVEINQVELNSPEKALQILQQVREATNIRVGLIRDGQRKVFEYDLE